MTANSTSFKKGQSGNPLGRIGGKSWSGVLKEVGEKKVTINGRKTTNKQAVLDLIYKKALKGESWAVSLLFDRIEGKAIARAQVDHTSKGESLNAEIVFKKVQELEASSKAIETELLSDESSKCSGDLQK